MRFKKSKLSLLYMFALLLQTRRHGNTRLVTAAVFGVDLHVAQAKSCPRGFHMTSQILLCLANQRPARSMTSRDVLNAVTVVKKVRAAGSLPSNQSHLVIMHTIVG